MREKDLPPDVMVETEAYNIENCNKGLENQQP